MLKALTHWDEKTIYRWFWVGVGITLAIFLLKFSLTGFGVFGDGLGYYTPLRSLIFDGNLRVDNEYRYYAQSASSFGGGLRVPGPIPEYSKYTLGLGLVLLPFFLLGHFLTLLLKGLGFAVEANGMTWPYELLYCLGSLTLGISALVLAYRLARRYFSLSSAALAVAGIWFASPLTYYLCLEVSMSHAVSAFLIAALVYLTVTRPWLDHWPWQVALGGILGMAAWVRPQDGLFLVVPLVLGWLGQETPSPPPKAFVWPWRRLLNQTYLRALVVILAITLVMQIPQALIYLWQYGGLQRIPYLEEGQARGYGGSFNWLQPALWQVLFSGHRGLFIWHPLTLLATIGLGRVWRHLPRLSLSLGLAFVLQIYFIAAWWCWWQGASVGGRMFSNCTIVFVFGLAALWDSRPHRSWLKIGLGATLFFWVWNALIVMQYQSAMIPPEAPVSLTQLYQNQFRVIPFFIQHLLKRLLPG
jgi:hypothetical protein